MKSLEFQVAEKTLFLLDKYDFNKITVSMVLKSLKKKKNNNFQIKDKIYLLKSINNYFDKKLIKISESIEKSTTKDMIFELLMVRFDILNEHRSAVIKIYEYFKKNPNFFVSLLPDFINSIDLITSIAKMKKNKKSLNFIKLNGLLVIYFAAFLTWKNDKNSSLDKTMNTLHKYLNDSERVLKLIS
ncbi:MAG: hypothetical protein CFH19_00293 [Alphaproteobacteria bacterium MarineAlpha5_Bin9]|nr:MAG: hypothetical protein CFH19_00293 [Alphaproteobacteria bacterium MarineAlpha5_Bin9]|tara:strand:- start:2180 stop:2737 length:558 start_codon:yes stop_codon:yes gene_type:complete